MTATGTWLETYNGGQAALSLVIEGFGTTFSTGVPVLMTSTFSGAAAPYDQWDDPIGGMKVAGTLSSSIKLYQPDIEPDTLEVSIVDSSEVLIGSMFRENSSAGHITFLTANLLAGNDHTEGSGAGIIAVKSTTGFASSGTLYIGGDAISYSGTTATTFTGCARGVYAVNQTNGGTNFSPSHLIGNNVTASARTAPAVTDYPRTWYGRWAHVLWHVREPVKTGLYNTADEARKIFSGRITNYRDEGDGTITITLKSCLAELHKPVGPDQWRARVNEGSHILSSQDTLGAVRFSSGTNYYVATNLGLSGRYTHGELAALVNDQFDTNTWDSGTTTTAGDAWRLDLVDSDDGGPPRYRIQVTANVTAFATGDSCAFRMGPVALALLGFTEYGDSSNTFVDTTTDERCTGIFLQRVSSAVYEAYAPRPPVLYYFNALSTDPKVTLEVSQEVNTFSSQTSTDFLADPDVNGVVEIKGGDYNDIVAVKYSSGSPSTLKVFAILNKTTGLFVNYTPSTFVNRPIRVGDQAEPPTVKQVLFYRGPAGSVLLKTLLSTGGASGYNHATYDSVTVAGFGVGVPSSLIDIPSWERMDDITVALVVGEPKPFYELLEPILAASGRYVVWKSTAANTNPKIAIVRPALDTGFLNAWTLTESNKADNTRTKVERAADDIINRIVVKYGQGITGSTESSVTLTVDDVPSQSDYGRRRTVTVNAGPIVNVPEVVSQTIGPALAYFARPVATVERSYNASLMRMAPGDTVTLIDSYAVDPATGTRGITAYGWCLDTRFDLATGIGRLRMVFLPEKSPNYTGFLAPSARVDETAGGGGWSGDVSKILTLKAHEFSDSTSSTADAARFPAGHKVRVRQIDASAPITWVDTVASQTGNTVTLTTGSGGTFDSSKRYVLEYADIGTVVSAQRESAFLADATTLSTGYTPSTPFEWGQPAFSAFALATPDYATGMFRPDSTYDDQGEPLSVHKVEYVARAVNSLLGYRTRQVLLSEYFGDLTQVGTTDKLVYMAWVPVYGHIGRNGSRGLKVRVRGKQTGGGTTTFTVASSSVRPSGLSLTSFSFPSGSNTVSATTTSSTNVWTSELSLASSPQFYISGIPGNWISLYIHGSGGGITATANQLWVAEAGL